MFPSFLLACDSIYMHGAYDGPLDAGDNHPPPAIRLKLRGGGKTRMCDIRNSLSSFLPAPISISPLPFPSIFSPFPPLISPFSPQSAPLKSS